MDSTLVASLVGFGSAITTAILASALTRRRLRHELQSAYRGDLARKQIAACEALWATLEATSFSPGSDRVIVDAAEAPKVNSEAALQLANDMTRIFYSSHGLFLSRQVREALVTFREFICDELVAETPESKTRSISKTKAD
jgi:hypothetical protein